jgi:RNA-directed DNA polymerase
MREQKLYTCIAKRIRSQPMTDELNQAKLLEKNVTLGESILNFSHKDARKFFLKSESYCRLELPEYFSFGNMLDKIDEFLDKEELSELTCPKLYDDINYTIFNNKDGKYAWRPFQLIHPVLYVSLVRCITEKENWKLICHKFREFRKNQKIHCQSLPVVPAQLNKKDKAKQILHWWHEVEQRSIELSLIYDFLLETDITDCYGAIYTHSIAWALHTKEECKKRLTKKYNKGTSKTILVGEEIDKSIQKMRHGQTNGIPQGSVLMDFISEIVLGYVDLELSKRIEKDKYPLEYFILRYRDDFRIFTNNPSDGEKIIKQLAEVTMSLGLKLNPQKTKASDNVIRSSIKPDKISWMNQQKSKENDLQKYIFMIHEHSVHFPNAGSLLNSLNDYLKKVLQKKKIAKPIPIITIVVDIAYRNPRTYPLCTAIISNMLKFVNSEEDKKNILNKILAKFEKCTNTGDLEIWMQRLSYHAFPNFNAYKEPLCKLVSEKSAPIWNIEWIKSKDLKEIMEKNNIIDEERLKKMNLFIQAEEVDLFDRY